MHRLAVILQLVLLASPFASCNYWQQNDQLFYSHPPDMNYTSARTYCHSEDGQLASNFTIKDSQFLQLISRETRHGSWLDAERTTGGYRWRLSGQLIEPEMWYPGSPNCIGHCAVYIAYQGELDAYPAFSTLYSSLCVQHVK